MGRRSEIGEANGCCIGPPPRGSASITGSSLVLKAEIMLSAKLLDGSSWLNGDAAGLSVGAGSSTDGAWHIAQPLQRQKLQSSKARVLSHTPSAQVSASASYGVNGSHFGPGGGGPGGSGSGGAGGGCRTGGGDGMAGITTPSQALHARQAQRVHDVVLNFDTWHHCIQRSLL